MPIQYTPNYQIPYPQGGDPADVPKDIAAMAARIDTLIKTLTDSMAPIGMIMLWTKNALPPAGTSWEWCWGQPLSRTGTYAALFNTIGTIYGAGNGSSTFNVPDLRGRVPIGPDDSNRINLPGLANGGSLGNTGGAGGVKLKSTQLGNHHHTSGTLSTGDAGLHTHDYYRSQAALDAAYYAGVPNSARPATEIIQTTVLGGGHNHSIEGITDGAGGDEIHQNVPPYQIIHFIIRYA
jgi:microcystin-dependent protein